MKKLILLAILLLSIVDTAFAQGPPILLDKPIMIGENKSTIRTWISYHNNKGIDFWSIPIMYDYNIRNNIQVGVALPIVFSDIQDNKIGLGDVSLKAKYQFFRKDGMGKTFRMAAKVKQTFPLGKDVNTPEIGAGNYRTYLGLIAGYESVRYGILSELGYNFITDGQTDNFIAKLGFGLPLLKPKYPVKQLNLYFEYEAMALLEKDSYGIYYAQGFQYAINQYTIDLSVQMPLTQSLPDNLERKLTVLVGGRVIF